MRKHFPNTTLSSKTSTSAACPQEILALEYGPSTVQSKHKENCDGVGALTFAAIGWAVFATAVLAADLGMVAPGAKIEKLADGFQFTEGPAADAEGNVYFTDQPNDRIVRWSAEGEVSTFLQPCGRSNGLCFDAAGNFWACADEKNEPWRIDREGKAQIVVGKYQDNSSMVRTISGSARMAELLYRSVLQAAVLESGTHGTRMQCVYYLPPDHQNLGSVADNLEQPNGVIGTPDGKLLYVADIKANKTYAYDIQADGARATNGCSANWAPTV